MNEEQFYQYLQRRLAQTSVGASSLRNQGAGGIISECRNYFQNVINLRDFIDSMANQEKFKSFLDGHTENLVKRFDEKAQRWGAARKGLSLFLRDVVYNKFFSNFFSMPDNFDEFNNMIQFLEVPLDKFVALGIDLTSNGNVPLWLGIRYLTPTTNCAYQEQAMIIAKREGIARIHLDLKYYRPE